MKGYSVGGYSVGLQCERLRETNDNGLRSLGTHLAVLSAGYSADAKVWEASVWEATM